MRCLVYPFGRRCGKCPNCRKYLQFEKGLRLTHESQYWTDGVFLTLTYNPEHLPENGSLVKSDPSDFMKRFRSYLPNVSLKYAYCGEYGPHGDRPHYHIIIFGVRSDDERVFKKVIVPGCREFHVCPAWKKGFITLAPINDSRCFYVAKYCVKKLFGDLAVEEYEKKGRIPEFYCTSRGIGERWIKEHQKRVKMDNFISFRGKKSSIPRYYIDKVYLPWEKTDRVIRGNKEQLERMKKDEDEYFRHVKNSRLDPHNPNTIRDYYVERFKQAQREYARRHEFQIQGLKNE